MRLKPKYIIQLAIAFSDLFIILAIIVVILHFVFGPNETVCHFFVVFFMGISYNCFFLNYFLSVIECFVAITFPLWHRVYVTPRLIVYGLIGLNLAMVLTVEWPFITGFLPVRCALQANHGLIINGISSVFFLLCFTFCCIDFGITLFHIRRASLPSFPSVEVAVSIPLIIISPPSLDADQSTTPIKEEIQTLNDHHPVVMKRQSSASIKSILCRRLSVILEEEESEVEETVLIDLKDSGSSGSANYEHCAVIAVDSCSSLSPLEWRAIKMFLISVFPLFIIPLPLLLFYYFFHLYCENINLSSRQKQITYEQCSDLTWLITSLFFLLLGLHSLVNPITSLWLNKDLKKPSPIRRLRMRLMPHL